jgi:hypothetical protein
MKLLVARNFRTRFADIAQDSIDQIAAYAKQHSPDVIVFTGNISQYEKRTLVFAEQIASATSLPVVLNLGALELCNLVSPEFITNALKLRLKINERKTNVYWAEEFKSDEVEFKCVVGRPIVNDTPENYKNSFLGRWFIKERSAIYKGDELIAGGFPKVFSVDEFNQQHLKEEVPSWTPGKKHILLTSISQENDELLTVNYSPAKSFGEDVSIGSSGEQLSIIEV